MMQAAPNVGVSRFLRGSDFQHKIRGIAPHVEHLGDAALDGLLSWDDLAEILDTGLFDASNELLFTRNRVTAPTDGFTRLVPGRDGAVDRELVSDRCNQLFDDGYTLTLVRVDRRRSAVRALCRDLERIIGDPVAANAYAVRDEAIASGPHCDPHEIIVLQLAGAKRWRIYEPNLSDRHDTTQARTLNRPPTDVSSETCALDVTLEAGDLLYLPRAWWHDPVAAGGPSLHLTIGLHTVSGGDFLKEIFATGSYRGALRDAAPSNATDEQLAALATRVAETVRQELTPEMMRRVLERRAIEAVSHTPVVLHPQAPGADAERFVWVGSRRAIVRNEGHMLVVSANNREIQIPANMQVLLDRLQVGEISEGSLDEIVGPDSVLFAQITLRRLVELGVAQRTTTSTDRRQRL